MWTFGPISAREDIFFLRLNYSMLTFWGWLGFVSLSPAVLSTGWEGHSGNASLFWTPTPVALSAHGPIWRVQKCPAEHLLHALKIWKTSSGWISPKVPIFLALARLVSGKAPLLSAALKRHLKDLVLKWMALPLAWSTEPGTQIAQMGRSQDVAQH